jgi:hypothetical protein
MISNYIKDTIGKGTDKAILIQADLGIETFTRTARYSKKQVSYISRTKERKLIQRV